MDKMIVFDVDIPFFRLQSADHAIPTKERLQFSNFAAPGVFYFFFVILFFFPSIPPKDNKKYRNKKLKQHAHIDRNKHAN